jgi:DNA-binding MarR family transcriptional regulator
MGGAKMVQPRASATRECYATALRKASRRLTALYDDTLAPSGLRSTQYAILGELIDGEPVTISELARALVLDRSGLGHSLRPLQRDGLVRLDKDAIDRRSVNVTITEEGRRRFEQVLVLWRSAQDRVVAVLGTSVADQLRDQLNGIAEDDRLLSQP